MQTINPPCPVLPTSESVACDPVPAKKSKSKKTDNDNHGTPDSLPFHDVLDDDWDELKTAIRKVFPKKTSSKNKHKMATTKKKATAKKTKRVAKKKDSNKKPFVSKTSKIRDLYSKYRKLKMEFRDAQKKIIALGYGRNTVVPAIWKFRIELGEIKPAKKSAKKPVKKSSKKSAKKNK
jgi:hypothetical protein